jgi:hypothetical protein
MKILAREKAFSPARPAARRSERGFLVIALLAIISIMLLYINFNMRLLGSLKRDLRLVEQAQIQRLEKVGAEPLPLLNTVTNRIVQ